MRNSTESPMNDVVSIDTREGTVCGPAGEVRLEPKVMDVLVVLATYAGHVVSREELLETVWQDVIVSEDTLSRCIYQLREKLRAAIGRTREEGFDPIETLPKRGYRLHVLVEQSPREFRVAGDRLLIELKRPTVLWIGSGLFVLFLVLFFTVLT